MSSETTCRVAVRGSRIPVAPRDYRGNALSSSFFSFFFFFLSFLFPSLCPFSSRLPLFSHSPVPLPLEIQLLSTFIHRVIPRRREHYREYRLQIRLLITSFCRASYARAYFSSFSPGFSSSSFFFFFLFEGGEGETE